MTYEKIILHKGKEISLQRHHPWVFSGAIKIKDANLKDGELVEIFSATNQFLGMGHFQNSSISVRIISFTQTEINDEFWFNKISKAYNYRIHLNILNETTNVCRLVFGEGDGLPGLIMDYYNGHIVFQAHSIGMHLSKGAIVKALQKTLGDKLISVYDKSADSLPKNYVAEIKNGYLYNPKNISSTDSGKRITVKENTCKFNIDWEGGQKTGFFVDQRDNRALLGKYSKDKMVLNTFCYTGGFSVYAAKAGAKAVHSVDSSKKAIALTDKNIELNNIQNHKSFAEDTFDFLKGKENIYDVIILDPPAFAKHQNVKHNAVQGYKRLNEAAIRKIKPNGILFTYSCSQVIDRKLFYNTVMAAAILAGRNIRVMHHLSQPADHPVNIFHPEGEYLKGLVLYVE